MLPGSRETKHRRMLRPVRHSHAKMQARAKCKLAQNARSRPRLASIEIFKDRNKRAAFFKCLQIHGRDSFSHSAIGVIPRLQLGDHPISRHILKVHYAFLKKEAMMQNPNARFALALLVPALLGLSISEAAAASRSSQALEAKRAECFRQANEAASAVLVTNPGATTERNVRGSSAYHDCAGRMGIRP
ncbi:hypothetical protein SAMN05444159_4790 [Bradyrhizobium lablabi]|uniref:Uncharacterized protein n=1 Tax=Bradyrhizobium lablabi TaxID=722472 RepID=A0A1M6X7X0_9BRAD|nr:hypothetical protein SAMN05444159_4790 [Bradyrhizobium lablabi]